MLIIKNFSKKYDKKIAVDNISLEVKDGEIFGFIGPNGAGKTTTIKALTGINSFNEGEIYINNISIKDNPLDCKKQLAYIPDNPDIYLNLTGIQYLNFIADIFEVDKEIRLKRIKEYATDFEIYDNLDDVISSYSHGMRQKLVIISALIHDPKLLVLDEPFVGLDPKSSHKLKEYMKKKCSEGTSVFFSSHVLEVVEKLCDHVAIINKGKIVAIGKVEEIAKDSSLEKVFLEMTEDE